MTIFTIYANGIEMGTYEAADTYAAADAYARDAGYTDMADCVATLGIPAEAALEEMEFVEVEEE